MKLQLRVMSRREMMQHGYAAIDALLMHPKLGDVCRVVSRIGGTCKGIQNSRVWIARKICSESSSSDINRESPPRSGPRVEDMLVRLVSMSEGRTTVTPTCELIESSSR